MPYGAARSNMQSMRPRSSGDRASASGAEGRRFESCRGHHGLRQLEAVFGRPPKHRAPRRALRNPIRLVSASAALAEGSNDAQHHHPDRGAHRAQQRSAAPTAREPLRRPGVLGVRRLRLGLPDEYGAVLAAAATRERPPTCGKSAVARRGWAAFTGAAIAGAAWVLLHADPVAFNPAVVGWPRRLGATRRCRIRSRIDQLCHQIAPHTSSSQSRSSPHA